MYLDATTSILKRLRATLEVPVLHKYRYDTMKAKHKQKCVEVGMADSIYTWPGGW